MFSKLTVITES